MAKKKKYYVVWEGHQPGVYSSWTECQLQIKAYPNAKYKSFSTREEAEAAFRGAYQDFISRNKNQKKKSPTRTPSPESRQDIIWDSVAVDAACSGNPGAMEYQGVYTQSGERLFHKKFSIGTNNIGEFLAIVHALALFHSRNDSTTPIYSDSRIALNWVKRKKCKTNLKKTATTAYLYQLIDRAEKWLRTHSYDNPLLKWNTKEWGEIPADFGRK